MPLTAFLGGGNVRLCVSRGNMGHMFNIKRNLFHWSNLKAGQNWNKLVNSMFKTYIKMNVNGRCYDAQALILWCFALASVSAVCKLWVSVTVK